MITGKIIALTRQTFAGKGMSLPFNTLCRFVIAFLPRNAGDIRLWVRSLGQEDPLEKGMVTRSNFLAWRIPWTEASGRLLSIDSQKFGHD